MGGTLAENLAHEQNDITVIDTDSQRLRELQDLIDIKPWGERGLTLRYFAKRGLMMPTC